MIGLGEDVGVEGSALPVGEWRALRSARVARSRNAIAARQDAWDAAQDAKGFGSP